MTWYIEEKLFDGKGNATLEDMNLFLSLWNCVCGTCIVCEACLSVVYALEEEE